MEIKAFLSLSEQVVRYHRCDVRLPQTRTPMKGEHQRLLRLSTAEVALEEREMQMQCNCKFNN